LKIFELFGDVVVNDKASQGINNINEKAKGLTKNIAGSITKITAWATAIGTAGVALGGALVNSASEAGDRVDKLSQQLGLSRQGFQEWDFILSQSGTSVEGLRQGMKTLVRSVDDLSLGTGTGAEAFERLGIKLEDVQGLTQEEIFEKVVTELQKMESGTEKAALAQDLLGRSGQNLMPLLNAESGSVEDLKNKAQELGLVLGDDAVDASVKFSDTVDQLKKSFGAIKNELGVSLMPVFQEFADKIIENMPAIRKVAEKAFQAIKKGVEIALIPLRAMYKFISDNWDEISLVFLKTTEKILLGLKFLVDGFKAFLDSRFFKKIKEGTKTMLSGVQKYWEKN
jgi:molybdopterin converting factor small subunit